MDFVQFCVFVQPFTITFVEFYFVILAYLSLRYTFSTKNNPEKKGNQKYFINELLVGIMYIVLAVAYPFLFHFSVPSASVRAQLYFHLSVSFFFHIPSWLIYVRVAQRNDTKKNRHITYEEFKEKIRSNYKDDIKSESKRKLLHLTSSGISIGFYVVGLLMNQFIFEPYSIDWDANTVAFFMQFNVGAHFLFAMSIGELMRFYKFEKLGQVARNWLEKSARPHELDTFSAASIMGLALTPFFLGPQSLMLSVVLIGSLSDAMASIVGKTWGKRKDKTNNKTIEGYIGGFLTTYLIVIIVNTFAPFPNLDWFGVNLVALGGALGFFLVDKYSLIITDNFLNPIVSGGLMALVYMFLVL
jgi:dolichol kinase